MLAFLHNKNYGEERAIFKIHRLARLFLLAPLALLPFAQLAEAGTINVPAGEPTIQAAIDAAVAGDEIIVAPGIYWETIDFLGKPITLKSSDGPLVTVIDGSQASGSVVQAVSGEGADTIIEGFTVTGGNVSDVGGGMRVIDSSPTVIDMIFTANHADDRGGGMYNRNANPLVMNSLFEGNSSGAMGGGMFNIEGSSPTIIGSRFTSNTSGKGAGMRNYLNSHAHVSKSIFSFNHAGEEGGGMDNRKNSNVTVVDTTFIGNTAGSGGGAIHNYVGRAADTGDQLFVNLLIVGNSAPSGGGIRNNDESPRIVNSTIAHNEGSGISSRKGSVPVLVNTVVWGNTGGSFSGQTAHLTIATYSIIEGGHTDIGNENVDPLFVNPGVNDYRLSLSSPAIDAGNSGAANVPAQDLDGNPRVIGSAVDMGAYEYGECSTGETCGPGNAAPMASFDFVCTELSCSFGDTSQDGDGIVAAWSWSFGDGNGSADQNPVHVYAAPGTYAVALLATDDNGATDSTSQSVTVVDSGPQPPTAPTNLTATVESTGNGKNRVVISVTLNWVDNSNYEDFFVIERCEETGKGKNKACIFEEYVLNVSAGATSYTDNNPASGTLKYQVKARNGSGDSAYTNEVKI